MSRNYKVALIIVISLVSLFGVNCADEKSPSVSVSALFDRQLDSLSQVVELKFLKAVTIQDERLIKEGFIAAREKYKRLEFYMEYFFPTTAVMINGAPIDEIELGENIVKQPTGFQVMEELIYETPTKENRAELLNEIKKMQLNLKRLARYNAELEITDAQVFDAIRLEILRITSLGITGFDTPTALQSLPEAASALKGISLAISCYDADQNIKDQLNKAVNVTAQSNFNGFDRLTFIVSHLQPVAKSIDDLRRKKTIETVSGSSAMRDDATNLFERNALNINAFVGNSTAYQTKEKIALGKMLFTSTILSNDGTKSCQSCHQSEKAFTDGLAKASGLRDLASGKEVELMRNTPTLTYAGYQRAFFYDLKAGSLEDQALDVVHHKLEMNGSLVAASGKINKLDSYKRAAKKAFGSDSAKITPWKIQHALSSYIRSLAPFNSRLDAYMRGDRSQLNEEEKTGFNLFMGKAKCGSCHFAPLFNGTQAPLFAKSEAEVLGVPTKADTSNAVVDGDEGRFLLNSYPQFKYAFKTTTLRNVSKTAPYMHNGVYKTLEQVLDFYNRGGGAGIGIKVPNQTLAAEPLNLSPKEIRSIIAFLKTLDDR